jgi:hypothetical protein
MIVVVLGAGVVAVFVKNDQTSPPRALPAPTASVTVAPTTSVSASLQTPPDANAMRSLHKDGVDNVRPVLPITGVGSGAVGFLLVGLASFVFVYVRRAARA